MRERLLAFCEGKSSLGTDRPETWVRWVRAWFVCVQAALVANDDFGKVLPWKLELSLGSVALPYHHGGRQHLYQAVPTLHKEGLIALDGLNGADTADLSIGPETRFTVSPDLFTADPAALEVDWPRIIQASGGEPAQLLVARALADMLRPLGEYSVIARSDFVQWTNYQTRQVRTALQRLSERGLVDIDGKSGATMRYRFSRTALSLASEASESPIARVDTSASQTQSVASANKDWVDIHLGNVAVSVESGLQVRVGRGPDGRMQLFVSSPEEK